MSVKSKESSEKSMAIDKSILEKAWSLMSTAHAMTLLFEREKAVTAKYVHATSRGHEAIQLACGMQLKPQDYIYPYYRDDSILLGIGLEPKELMLQLLAKKADPFSGAAPTTPTLACGETGCQKSRITQAPQVCRPYPAREQP